MVNADACHGHEALVKVIGILCIATDDIFLLVKPLSEIGLTNIVVVERGTECKVVLRSEVSLEHQLRVDVLLVDVVSLTAVGGIHLVHRGRRHPGDVCAVAGIEDKGVLHIPLVAVGVEINAVDWLGLMVEHTLVVGLSALALLVQERETTVEDIVARLAIPAVLQVELPCLRVVHKSVFVAVVLLKIVLIVSEDLGAQSLDDVYVSIGIGLDAAHGVAIEVDVHILVVFGLEILHVDLSRHSLVAVFHTGIALAHLYAFHPCAWHIA